MDATSMFGFPALSTERHTNLVDRLSRALYRAWPLYGLEAPTHWLGTPKCMLYRFRHKNFGPIVITWWLLTVASVVMSALVWNGLSRSLNASAEATRLGESLNQVFSALQDAETGQQGFLLTGNDAYLEPFTNA